ncbi:hypothetical protein ACHAQA_002190 [Verticillium albo-atrum]
MYPTRLIHLLLVTLGFIAVAQAISHNIDGSQKNAVVRRQDTEASPSVAPEESSPADPSASPSQPADEQTTTAEDTPVASEATTTPPTTTTPSTTTPVTSAQASSANGGGADASTTPAPSAAASSAQSAPTTSAQDNSNSDSSNNNSDSSDNETTASSAEEAQTTAEPVTSTIVTVLVTTNAQGETTSVTTASVVTSTPGLSAEDNDNGSGGMPVKTRNIVIGVVVGVGGAIILGALAFVGFRIHNRKKRQEENDGLMDYNTAGTSAFNSEPKPDTMSGSTATNNNRSPFQTNLESYHQPTQVNASSNF